MSETAGKRGLKLHSIIEKLSEQCGRSSPDPSHDGDSEDEGWNSSEIIDKRRKRGSSRVKKVRRDEEDTVEDINVETVESEVVVHINGQESQQRGGKRKLRGKYRVKRPSKQYANLQRKKVTKKKRPANNSFKKKRNLAIRKGKNKGSCQRVDEDLCIDVNALMTIIPQVQDIDVVGDDVSSSVSPQGTCRLCFEPVNSKTNFLEHFRKAHPECIKANDPFEEEEESEDSESQSAADPDFEDMVGEVLYDADDEVLEAAVMPSSTKRRRSTRLKAKKQGATEKEPHEPEAGSNKDSESDIDVEGDIDVIGDIDVSVDNNNAKEDTTSHPIKNKRSAEKTTKIIPCKLCDNTFYWQAELLIHIEEDHAGSEEADDGKPGDKHTWNYCDHCNKTFFWKEALKLHVKKMVKRMEDSHRPKQQRAEDEQKKCPKCDKTFKSSLRLSKHVVTHSDERPHKCKVCGRGFKDKNYVYRHMTTHTGIKKYTCEECGKLFAHKGSLRTHIMIHTGERPHKCHYCDMGFISNFALRIHENKHTGNMPYKCPQCNKGFPKSYGLKMHMISHSNEKPFACEVCGKAFKRRDHLREHKIIHSENKPFKCDTCNKTFNQNICLRKHLPCKELEKRQKRETAAKEPKPQKMARKPRTPKTTQTQKTAKTPTEPKDDGTSTQTNQDAPSDFTKEQELDPSSDSVPRGRDFNWAVNEEVASRPSLDSDSLGREGSLAHTVDKLGTTADSQMTPLGSSALSLSRNDHDTQRSSPPAVPLLGTNLEPPSSNHHHINPNNVPEALSSRFQGTSERNVPVATPFLNQGISPVALVGVSPPGGTNMNPMDVRITRAEPSAGSSIGSVIMPSRRFSPPALINGRSSFPKSPNSRTFHIHGSPFDYDKNQDTRNRSHLHAAGPGTAGAFSAASRMYQQTRFSDPCMFSSNVPQPFVPFSCTSEGSSMAFHGTEGLQLDSMHCTNHGNGAHMLVDRAYPHDTPTDLSNALLAAMDPDHLSGIVDHSTVFFSNT